VRRDGGHHSAALCESHPVSQRPSRHARSREGVFLTHRIFHASARTIPQSVRCRRLMEKFFTVFELCTTPPLVWEHGNYPQFVVCLLVLNPDFSHLKRGHVTLEPAYYGIRKRSKHFQLKVKAHVTKVHIQIKSIVAPIEIKMLTTRVHTLHCYRTIYSVILLIFIYLFHSFSFAYLFLLVIFWTASVV
jgi:hypothetical protein